MAEKERELRPIIGHRALYKLGRSYAITIPSAWFKAHNIDPNELSQLLLVANHDIRVVNPDHDAEVYDEVTRIARDVR